jgi:hypothetical protein
MAYLRDLLTKCASCSRRATVELIDRWNGSRGSYCSACGKRALKRQTENENASVKAGR